MPVANLFDLESRTEQFAENCRILVRAVSKDIADIAGRKQTCQAQ